jgi:DNA repair protein RadD
MSIVLRPYQAAAVDALRHAYRAGHRAPLFQLPTGGGKTIVFAEIIRSAKARGTRVLVLVHRRELIRQACEKLDWAGVSYGIIAPGFDPNPDELVQVASVQTVRRRLATLPHFDFLILDEAHHGRARTWLDIIEAQPQARLLGVTATPARLDGKGLGIAAGGIFDTVVTGPSIRELVELSFLAPSRVFVPQSLIDLRGVRTRGGDFVAGDLAKRVDKRAVSGDAVEHYRMRANHAAAIAFGCTVAHCEHVAEQFREAGYRSECVHGGLKTRERDRLIAGLGTGEVEVLTSCDLISEGLDVPSVSAVILLRPTKSLVLHMQQVGRGMRPAPRKTALVVNDHAGNTLRHGLPDQERIWSLDGVEKGPPPEIEIAEDGEAREPTRRPPAEIVDNLEEVTAERIAVLAGMSYQQITQFKLPEAELRAYANLRGYKIGWAWHRLREQREAAP